jgi:hypothetical protein
VQERARLALEAEAVRAVAAVRHAQREEAEGERVEQQPGPAYGCDDLRGDDCAHLADIPFCFAFCFFFSIDSRLHGGSEVPSTCMQPQK